MEDKNLGDQIKNLVLKIAKDLLAGTDGWQWVNFNLSFNAKNVPSGVRLTDFEMKTEVQANQRKVDLAPIAKEGWRVKKKSAAQLERAATLRNSPAKNLTSGHSFKGRRGRPRKDAL